MKATIALYTIITIAAGHIKGYEHPAYKYAAAPIYNRPAPLTAFESAIRQQVLIPNVHALPYRAESYYGGHNTKHSHQLVKHSLVPVQVPVQVKLVVPAVVPTRPQFTAERARMGKVVDRTEPVYFCKNEDFTLEGEICYKTLLEEAKFVCPGGYESVGGACERRAQLLSTCPAGYSQREGGCSKLITASLVPHCPPESFQTSDGGCERQVVHPLTPTCPEGTYNPRTGQCICSTTVEARAFCPEGFAFNDGTCLQEDVYDCTDAPRAAPIQTAYFAAGPFKHTKSHRMLSAKECSTPCQGEQAALCIAQRVVLCEQPTRLTMQPATTVITVQKTCTRVTSTGLVFACDEGTLKGNICVIQNAVAPMPICTADGGVEDCHVRQRVAPLFDCPAEFTKQCHLGSRCQCVAYESVAQAFRCPSGFDSDDGACVRTSEARAVCPAGFTLEGTSCIRTIREPADCQFQVTYECDKLHGDCIPPARAVVPTPYAAPPVETAH